MDSILSQPEKLITSILDGLTQQPGSTGAILGLIGLMIQLWVRGEWPTGRINEGAPKVVDLQALILAVFAAVAAGVLAANHFNLSTDQTATISSCQTKTDVLATKENVKNALTLVAFGYVAADLRPMMEKIIDLVKKVGAFFGIGPNNQPKS
jgi:hypothetical protein